ncbi:MAG: hypothetical protein LBT54_03365, partial [Bifidobacteriaceae bacterium]|nr:hypothetical protein [Bifidobacteriaceae bacterium]
MSALPGAPGAGPKAGVARRGVDVAVALALLAAALAPLQPVFGGAVVLAPAAGGLMGGALVAVLGRWRGWPALVTAAAGVVGFAIVGSIAVAPQLAAGGVLPTVGSVAWLGSGAVNVWARLLTVAVPVGGLGGFILAPFALGYAGALVSVSLALSRRWRMAAASLLVPAAVLAAALVLGARESFAVLPSGLGWGGLALAWAAWRGGRFNARRVVALGVMAGLAGAAGWAAGTVLPDQRDRFVLRDRVEPPFDPRDWPSPLSAYRHYVKDLRDDVVLEVSGLPADGTVRLAVMDNFDGVVWNVAGGTGEGDSGEFRRVGGVIGGGEAGGSAAQVTLKMRRAEGVWLYSVGTPVQIEFASGGALELAENVRHNQATGAFAVPDGLPGVVDYRLTAVPSRRAAEARIVRAGAGGAVLPEPS